MDESVGASVSTLIEATLGEDKEKFLLPPPVYETISAEVVEVDAEQGVLWLRFPMLRRYLNPYGTMQGGMIAAAIDNTIGPLSMLVAPPNVTRSMELEYFKPVPGSLSHVLVCAKLTERHKRRLVFEASVQSPNGDELATARAVHLVVAGLAAPPSAS
ncbi:MAG: PaaI family thioesterase [Desulfuromonas sp.]|nr:MAG: PaaI family thioesterase [Desulfuromonas sp.]